MLPGTLGLQFADDEMRIDLPDLCEQSNAKLILSDTSGIDLQTRKVQFADRAPIAFDALSIGVGSIPAGSKDHRDADCLVPIKPMQTFLQRMGKAMQEQHVADVAKTIGSATGDPKFLKRSATRRVAIVGGGVASVEIALCLKQQCEKLNVSDRTEIEIFTSSECIAEELRPRSIAAVERILKSRRILIHPGHRVTEVGPDFIMTEDGKRHDADVVIWATGAAAPPVLGRLGLQTDDRGFIATKKTLQSISDPRVFAVGDSGTILESPSPKAGVYAVRQCPVLWHNLQALFSGDEMMTFEPQADFLKLLNTGDGKALLQYSFVTAHARWCWHLKTWIDKRFVTRFQNK